MNGGDPRWRDAQVRDLLIHDRLGRAEQDGDGERPEYPCELAATPGGEVCRIGGGSRRTFASTS